MVVRVESGIVLWVMMMRSTQRSGVNLVGNLPIESRVRSVKMSGGDESGDDKQQNLPEVYPEDSASQVGGGESVTTNDDMFSDAVKRWFQLDDEIKALGRAARIRRKEKKDITSRIVEIMEEAEVDNVKGRDGMLSVTRTTAKVPLTKENIRKTLAKRFTNPQQVEELVSLLTDERDKVERVNLRRKKLKP